MSSVQHVPSASIKPGLRSGSVGGVASLPGIGNGSPGPERRPVDQAAQTVKDAVGIFAAIMSPFALGQNPSLARQGFKHLALPGHNAKPESPFGKRKRALDETTIQCNPMARLNSANLMKPATTELAKLPMLASRKEGRHHHG